MSGGASIIVTGVLMTVDSECSVAISSLGEAECQPPTNDPTNDPTTDSTSTTTDSTAAIIGGVVAAILIIALTFAAVTITYFKIRGNSNKRIE